MKVERNYTFYKDGEETTKDEFMAARKDACRPNQKSSYMDLAVPLYVKSPTTGEYIELFKNAVQSKEPVVEKVEKVQPTKKASTPKPATKAVSKASV